MIHSCLVYFLFSQIVCNCLLNNFNMILNNDDDDDFVSLGKVPLVGVILTGLSCPASVLEI